jgi:hypothetical protein
MSAAVVFGGYGTFGTHVVRELARLGIAVVVAGRDGRRAEELARLLGRPHRGVQADASSLESCLNVLHAPLVAVNCAGPFHKLGTAVLEACLTRGCHYADIADDRAYTAQVRRLHWQLAERGLAAVYGCSSLPGLSGVLAALQMEGASARPLKARITLFIGNANPKGEAAIASLLHTLGQPVDTPVGMVKGYRQREVVELPMPFGKRGVFNFLSPEYDLFPQAFGVRQVAVKVGFELRLATYSLAMLAALGGPGRASMQRWLGPVGGLFSGVGSSGGAVMTELFWKNGRRTRAALLARSQGQTMAAMPCVLAVEALCNENRRPSGALALWEFLDARTVVERLKTEGVELILESVQG